MLGFLLHLSKWSLPLEVNPIACVFQDGRNQLKKYGMRELPKDSQAMSAVVFLSEDCHLDMRATQQCSSVFLLT